MGGLFSSYFFFANSGIVFVNPTLLYSILFFLFGQFFFSLAFNERRNHQFHHHLTAAPPLPPTPPPPITSCRRLFFFSFFPSSFPFFCFKFMYIEQWTSTSFPPFLLWTSFRRHKNSNHLMTSAPTLLSLSPSCSYGFGRRARSFLYV